MTELRFQLVDVFTDEAFSGNQLAVFPDVTSISDELMQQIASEFSHAETTFVLPAARQENDFQLRLDGFGPDSVGPQQELKLVPAPPGRIDNTLRRSRRCKLLGECRQKRYILMDRETGYLPRSALHL